MSLAPSPHNASAAGSSPTASSSTASSPIERGIRSPPASSSTEKSAQTTSDVDWNALRQDFPILSQLIHGQPLVYLDNAATTQ